MEVDFHARVTEYQSALRRLRLLKGEASNNRVGFACVGRLFSMSREKGTHVSGCTMPGIVLLTHPHCFEEMYFEVVSGIFFAVENGMYPVSWKRYVLIIVFFSQVVGRLSTSRRARGRDEVPRVCFTF